MEKINKTKELVTLRKKPLERGGSSLYLDYSINGTRHKEYLKMYLVPEVTKLDKITNKETVRIANAAKAKKILAIERGDAGLQNKCCSLR